MFCHLRLGRYTLGLIFLLLVVCIWVFSSALIEFIEKNEEFYSPFFVTYFSTSLFTIYLSGFIFCKRWRNIPEDLSISGRKEIKEVARLSLLFCFLWFFANYSFNLSLGRTSVSSNTVLSTTSSLFALVFGVLFGVEVFSVGKIVAVLLSLFGAVCIGASDVEYSGGETLLGDCFAFFAAAAYGVYVTFMRKTIPNEQAVSMPMLFGFVGLFNATFLWPLFFLLNYTHVEDFVQPSRDVWICLVINGVLGTVISDVLWSVSIFLTSPLVATCALSLTVPLAACVDVIFHSKRFHAAYYMGSLLLVCGFVLVNITSPGRERRLWEIMTDWKCMKMLCCNDRTAATHSMRSFSDHHSTEGSAGDDADVHLLDYRHNRGYNRCDKL